MRSVRLAAALVVLLGLVVPLSIAARPEERAPGGAGLPGAGVILEAALLEVGADARRVDRLVTIPEGARWAVVKNVSAVLIHVGVRERLSAADGWPLGPGDELAFSLESPVYLKAGLGTVRAPVLIGR